MRLFKLKSVRAFSVIAFVVLAFGTGVAVMGLQQQQDNRSRASTVPNPNECNTQYGNATNPRCCSKTYAGGMCKYDNQACPGGFITQTSSYTSWYCPLGNNYRCCKNAPPSANAGADKTITLPTNSVTLSGDCNDADTDSRNLKSCTWTKETSLAGSIQSPTSESTNVTGLAQGSHTFKLTASDGYAAVSDTVIVTVNAEVVDATPPTAPTNLNATAVSTSQINLAWTASTDNKAVTGYKIFRDGAQIATATGTSYQNTGLTPSTTYKYTVSAYDAAGNNSAKSNEDSATTQSEGETCTIVSDTTNEVVGGGNAVATYKFPGWTASIPGATWIWSSALVENPNVDTTKTFNRTFSLTLPVVRASIVISSDNSYEIGINGTNYFSGQDNWTAPNTHTFTTGSFKAGVNTLSVKVKNFGLATTPQLNPAGVLYKLTIIAEDCSTTPVDITAPTVPTNLNATAISTSQINLTWTASSDNKAVSGYKVFRNGTQVATVTTNSYQDTGLTPDTLYKYQVSAFDGAGNNSAKSNEAQATTFPAPDTKPPSVPINLAATAVSTSQINTTWSASTDNDGVTGYKVFRDGVLVTTTTSTFFQNTGLDDDTVYVYQVSAFDNAGNNSAKSNEAQARTHKASVPSSRIALDLLMHGIGKAGDSVKPGEAGGGNMSPTRVSRQVTVTVFNLQNQVVATKQGTVSFNSQTGSFKGEVDLGSDLANGTYIIKVKLSQSLVTQIAGAPTLTKGQTTNIVQTSLVTGDINNDGAISLNVLDYNILVDCISKVNCSNEEKLQADLDDNGKVDQFDFNLFMREITHIQ